MSGIWKKGGLCAMAATMMCASAPAEAAMRCWTPAQVAAAKIRDLQSRLMVASLRRGAMGVDVTRAYNRFVVANRAALQHANGVILAQFQAGHGALAQVHYDRFTTALANAYGADATDRGVCAETEALAHEAADAVGDAGRLTEIADRHRFASALPGGRCGDLLAAAASAD